MLKFQTLTRRTGERSTPNRRRSHGGVSQLHQLFDVDESHLPSSSAASNSSAASSASQTPAKPPPVSAVHQLYAKALANESPSQNGSIHNFAHCSSTLPRPPASMQQGRRMIPIGGQLQQRRMSSTPCLERRYDRYSRSTSVSSLSSTSSSSENSSAEWATIRIYTKALRSDCDYKTFFIPTSTTALEIIQMLMEKLNTNVRDTNLCYLAMDVKTVHEGSIIENSLILDKRAKPLELQACHPKDRTRFSLQMRKGTLVRIYDSAVVPQSNYKSLIISEQTTCLSVINMLLQSYDFCSTADEFELVLIDTMTGYEHFLLPDDNVLTYETQSWWTPTHQFHLRPVSNILSIPVCNFNRLSAFRRNRLQLSTNSNRFSDYHSLMDDLFEQAC